MSSNNNHGTLYGHQPGSLEAEGPYGGTSATPESSPPEMSDRVRTALLALPENIRQLQWTLWSQAGEATDARALQERMICSLAEHAMPAVGLTTDPPTKETSLNTRMTFNNKALIRQLRPIPDYSGWIRDDAARMWIRDCERYFQDIVTYSGELVPDGSKVIAAKGHLVKRAATRWRAHEESVLRGYAPPISTWKAFVDWIMTQFKEHLGEQRRWEKYEQMEQGRDLFPDYASKLQEAAAMLEVRIPEEVIRRRLIAGARKNLQAQWAKERDPPQDLAGTISRFSDLEQGTNIAKDIYRGDHDAMDLTAIQEPPVGAPRTMARHREEAPRPKALEPTRRCFSCGSSEHLKKDCPKREQRLGKGQGR